MVLSKTRNDSVSSDPFADRFVYEESPTPKKRAKVKPLAVAERLLSGAATTVHWESPKAARSTSLLIRVAQLLGLVLIAISLAAAGLSRSSSSTRDTDLGIHEPSEGTNSIDHDHEPATALSSLTPELQVYVQRLVSTALRDPVERRDFALIQDGAVVISKLTLPVPAYRASKRLLNGPEAALRDDLRIGECWLVHSNSCQLGIGLQTFIAPTHVTVDHIPLEVVADIGQAPRKMLLWGLVEGTRNLAIYRDLIERGQILLADTGRQGPLLHDHSPYVLLASFDYNILAPFHIQTFPISSAAIEEGIYFGVVVLEVLENWGADTTCLYRIRIHGNKIVL